MPFTVGTRLGVYDIIAVLGAGGMGDGLITLERAEVLLYRPGET
jgi:hypothetical protein